jgi:hypothetical protein
MHSGVQTALSSDEMVAHRDLRSAQPRRNKNASGSDEDRTALQILDSAAFRDTGDIASSDSLMKAFGPSRKH